MGEQVQPRLKVGRSYPPDKIGLRLTSPGGSPIRLAEDERDRNNLLSNLRLGTEIPGGFKELSNVLNRLPQRVWPELETNSDVVAYLASGKHVFEGYVDKAPNVSGAQASITPTILGYQSMMEDQEGIVIGWTSKDHGRWTESPVARKLALGVGYKPVGPQSEYGISGALVRLKCEGKWNTVKPIGEMWFDAGSGIRVGAVNAKFEQGGNTASNLAFELLTFMSDNGANVVNVSSDFFTAVAGECWNGPLYSGHRYIAIAWGYTPGGEAGGDGFSFDVLLAGPVWIRSDRACALPATNYGTFATWGFLTQTLLVDLFAAKATNGLEARLEDIDNDGFILQEAWYDTPTTLAGIVKELIKYGWYDWFFYKGKRFSYKKPGTYGRTWKTTVAASSLNEVGKESTRAYDKCKVSWQDVSGEERSVGPIGSGATFESIRCEATAPARTRTKLLSIPGTLSETTAFELAERVLEEAALSNISGSATVTGYVMDEYGYMHPVSEVRAGDYLEVTDAHDRTPRKIVNTDYTHQNRQNQLDLAAPASGMEALLERLQESAAAAGV